MSQALRYFFMISIVLVLVAYFTGTVNIANALTHMIQTISYAATGRDSAGQFAAYPR